jgi:hypothetical protein
LGREPSPVALALLAVVRSSSARGVEIVLATVFVTQTGTRYHARVDMSCMEKAHGYTEIPIDAAADGGLVPCSTCGAPPLPGTTELDRQWLSAISDWARAGVFESFWEQAFARRVLAQVQGITVDDVEPQALIAGAGEAIKVDFSVPKAGLVLEVDGYQKDGAPPSQSDIDRRNRRDAALQSRGLTVLHFSNAQVQQQPGICRDLVAQAVTARVSASSPQATATTPLPASHSIPPVTAPAASVVPAQKKSGRGAAFGAAIAAGALVIVAIIVVLASAGGGADDSAAVPPAVSSPAADVGAADPIGGKCPTGFDIKGNVTDERIAHSPGDKYYDETDPERCFADLAAAEKEGFRPAKR